MNIPADGSETGTSNLAHVTQFCSDSALFWCCEAVIAVAFRGVGCRYGMFDGLWVLAIEARVLVFGWITMNVGLMLVCPATLRIVPCLDAAVSAMMALDLLVWVA